MFEIWTWGRNVTICSNFTFRFCWDTRRTGKHPGCPETLQSASVRHSRTRSSAYEVGNALEISSQNRDLLKTLVELADKRETIRSDLLWLVCVCLAILWPVFMCLFHFLNETRLSEATSRGFVLRNSSFKVRRLKKPKCEIWTYRNISSLVVRS